MDTIPRSLSRLGVTAVMSVLEGETLTRLIVILILVILGGIFSGAETALSYCNRTRMKTLASEGNRAAIGITKILNDYDKAIVTLLIVINIIHVSMASLSTVLCVELFGSKGTVISTVMLTLVVFIFSEAIPKNIANANADSLSLVLYPVIKFFAVVLTPLCFVFTSVGDMLKKLFSHGEKAPSMTEDELSLVIEDVQEKGVLDKNEKEIIQSAIEFSDLGANDVMTKVENIVALDSSLSVDDVKTFLLEDEHHYSRIPVYNQNIDKIVGVLQSIDFLQATLEKNSEIKVKDYCSECYDVSPEIKLNLLLEGMTRRHVHLAVVKSAQGKTLGIVTMDDILSEIVGDAIDEEVAQ